MKSYIGKTVDPDGRIRAHLGARGGCPVLCNAIKKYGADAFRVEFLEKDMPESVLSKMEILHIRFFDSKSPNGYNLTDGGEGLSGWKASAEIRRKQSEARRGERHHLYGKAHSQETRQKISDAHKGRKHSPETRRKMSEFRKGKKLSPHQKQKLLEANKGRKHSPETRQKISNSLKGKTLPPETRRKISEANKGKPAA